MSNGGELSFDILKSENPPPSIISNFLSLSRIILNFRFLQNKLHEQVLHIYINMDGDVYPF